MVHDQRSSYRPRTMERSARLVAHGVLTPRMVVGLLIGLPLALIVIYGFWLAGELGLAPAWRRRRAESPPIQDASDALDDEGRQVVNRR